MLKRVLWDQVRRHDEQVYPVCYKPAAGISGNSSLEDADFLYERPALLLLMSLHLYYQKNHSVPIASTRLFQEMEIEPEHVGRLVSFCEKALIGEKSAQLSGISENCKQAISLLRQEGRFPDWIGKLLLDSPPALDVPPSDGVSYYRFEADGQVPPMEDPYLRKLFSNSCFQKYGYLNVSTLTLEELSQSPLLYAISSFVREVYLYVYQLNFRRPQQITVKYLHWF